MYNGVSCAECHQNMAVLGGGAQAQYTVPATPLAGEHSGDNYFRISAAAATPMAAQLNFTR